jgi:TM2 domain-containing membrane protein YozV
VIPVFVELFGVSITLRTEVGMSGWGPQPQVVIVQAGRPKKDTGIAYLLWFFLGLWGAHRFYTGDVGLGVLYLFTAGGCGIGWLIDLFVLAGAVDRVNRQIDYENQAAAYRAQHGYYG